MNLDQAKLKVAEYLKDTYGDWVKLQMSHITTFEALKDSFIEEVSGAYRESMDMEEAVDSAKSDWNDLGIVERKSPSKRIRPAGYVSAIAPQKYSTVFVSDDGEVTIVETMAKSAFLAATLATEKFIAMDTDGDWDSEWRIVVTMLADPSKTETHGMSVKDFADDHSII